MTFSIELDCPPGYPRPGDLLPGVLEGTGITLTADDTSSRLFGNWEWIIPEDQTALFEQHRELIKQRITRLYQQGLIRYGSW